jgi:hypothetical protein
MPEGLLCLENLLFAGPLRSEKEPFMARSPIDSMDWNVNIILTVLADPLWQGVNRLLRGRVIIGFLWIITGGIFGIGWIIDVITMVTQKEITFLA